MENKNRKENKIGLESVKRLFVTICLGLLIYKGLLMIFAAALGY